jgi:hypothetical protein
MRVIDVHLVPDSERRSAAQRPAEVGPLAARDGLTFMELDRRIEVGGLWSNEDLQQDSPLLTFQVLCLQQHPD